MVADLGAEAGDEEEDGEAISCTIVKRLQLTLWALGILMTMGPFLMFRSWNPSLSLVTTIP